MTSPGCDAHAGASAELRALARTALDRIEPVLDRLRTEPPTSMESATCAACPLCALMAALRGERPELVQRLAEQLGGLVTLLRAALDETASDGTASDGTASDGIAEPAPPERTASGSPKTVQRIPIERPDVHAGGGR
jgi:hypothetical protein